MSSIPVTSGGNVTAGSFFSDSTKKNLTKIAERVIIAVHNVQASRSFQRALRGSFMVAQTAFPQVRSLALILHRLEQAAELLDFYELPGSIGNFLHTLSPKKDCLVKVRDNTSGENKIIKKPRSVDQAGMSPVQVNWAKGRYFRVLAAGGLVLTLALSAIQLAAGWGFINIALKVAALEQITCIGAAFTYGMFALDSAQYLFECRKGDWRKSEEKGWQQLIPRLTLCFAYSTAAMGVANPAMIGAAFVVAGITGLQSHFAASDRAAQKAQLQKELRQEIGEK